MGQSDNPNDRVTDGETEPPNKTRMPSLRQALNALMMSDERKKEGVPGDITLGMEISMPRHTETIQATTKSTSKADDQSSDQTKQGARNMSGNVNHDIHQGNSSEQMRIGQRGGHAAAGAPITLEAEPMIAATQAADAGSKKTQMVRGQQEIERAGFYQEPVVGWLVVIGGPGLGAYRPIFEGNNTLGRNKSQRIPIDFGDSSISGEEQVYIRYDSSDKSFLLVPNLTKTNVVAVNDKSQPMQWNCK